MDNAKMSLRDTIIPKSDQLNYDDVMDTPLAVRVTGLAAGSQEQPVIVHVAAMDGAALRDYKPCKSMRRVLISCWGDKGRDWVGKAMLLAGDPSVVFGGVRVGGIRIAAVSGIEAPRKIMLTTTRSKRAEYVVEAMKDA